MTAICSSVSVAFAALLISSLLVEMICAKEFAFKHYSYRKKNRYAKRYPAAERHCEAAEGCSGLHGLEMKKCIRICISKPCYDELYAWDELEEGEIDARANSFKGCFAKKEEEKSHNS